jgi:DNA transposition AAA+ family ATPase
LEVAANTLKNVGTTTLRNALNPEFINISDAMWRSIRSQIGGSKLEWVYVNTTAVEDLRFIMRETQQEQGFTWAISPAGSGKTVAATLYAKESKNVFHIQCDADMSKSDFAIDLARAVGLRVNTQKKARRLIMEVCEYLAELEDPLLIFDEGDKLRDVIIAYFITIYNRIHKVAGVIFLSTNYMEKRMEDGLRYNRAGYQELWSRLGRKFYVVDSNTTNDVQHICIENGLEQRASKTMQDTIREYNMQQCPRGRFQLIPGESVARLSERLLKPKAPDVVVIDSYQYTQMNYREYIAFKERHPDKMIIFVSHADGTQPDGRAAKKVKYDAELKIRVEGFRAFSQGRTIGPRGYYTVYEEGANKYWGENK